MLRFQHWGMKVKITWLIPALLLFLIFFTTPALAAAAPTPLTTIDQPASGEILSTKVTGQAINSLGIAGVDVYVYRDGKTVKIGSGKAPGATGGTYTAQVDVSQLKSGSYTLEVAGISNGDPQNDNRQTVQWATKNVLIGSAPSTTIRSSSGGWNSLSGTVTITGDVSNHSGIRQIDIYAYDSKGTPKEIGSGNASGSSYSVPVNMNLLKAGSYTLAVAGIGNDSDVAWAVRAFTVGPAASTTIRSSSAGWDSISGTVTIAGSVSNHSGIRQVDIYAYDSKGNPKEIGSGNASGGSYSIPVDMSKLTDGNYTLAVAGIGNDDDVVWAVHAFTVKASKTAVTTIGSSSMGWNSLSGTVTITGSVFNNSGIRQIDIYAYDSKGNPKEIGSGNASGSSYSVPVNMNLLKAGSYTLAVAGIGNDNKVVWAVRAFTVGPEPVLTINTLPNNASVSGNINIAGWALNHSGVSQVDIYLYDTAQKPTKIGSVSGAAIGYAAQAGSRYPQFGSDPKCDYGISYNMNDIGPGRYQLSVASIGNDGEVTWTSKIITYSADYPSFNISLKQMEADHPGVSPDALNPSVLYTYDSISKYELMSLNWVDGVTAADLDNMLTGCGNLTGHGQDFLDAARIYDINPVYLVAHAKLETGNGDTNPNAPSYMCRGIVFKNGVENYQTSSGGLTPVLDNNKNSITGKLVSGSTYTYTDPHGNKYNVADGTYYNLWGIHAYDGAASWGGGIWAGYENWNSIRAAVFGGAEWIAANYTTGQNYAQSTLYEMKWDPYGWSKGQGYEYATDYSSITDNWAYDVAKGIQKYADIFKHTAALLFRIPQFKD